MNTQKYIGRTARIEGTEIIGVARCIDFDVTLRDFVVTFETSNGTTFHVRFHKLLWKES